MLESTSYRQPYLNLRMKWRCSPIIWICVLVVPSTFSVNNQVGRKFTCNFDEDACGWTQNTTVWRRGPNRLKSDRTIPFADHTTGDGYYYYVENTTPAARFVSPQLAPKGTHCFSFWYQMQPGNVSKSHLNVYLKPTSSKILPIIYTKSSFWTVSKHAKWRQVKVDINGPVVKYQILIEGSTGIGGFVAIDDVSMTTQNSNQDTAPIRYPPTGNISTPRNYCKGSREFLCDNGRCILSGWRCDYWDDCGDSSDERGCYITVTDTTETYTTYSAPALHLPTGNISTQNNYCLGPREYLCDNGRCILTGWRCDNLDDCGDSSDERGCNITATDTTDTYTSRMSIETKNKETGSSETTFADSSYTLVTDVGNGTPETTPSDNMGLQTTDMGGTTTETVFTDTTFNTTTTAAGGISKATFGSTGRNTMMDKTLTTENTVVATVVAASREAVPHPYLNTPVVTGAVMLLALVIILTTLALVTMRNKKMRGLFYSFIDYRIKSSTKRGSGLQTTDVGKVSLIKFESSPAKRIRHDNGQSAASEV